MQLMLRNLDDMRGRATTIEEFREAARTRESRNARQIVSGLTPRKSKDKKDEEKQKSKGDEKKPPDGKQGGFVKKDMSKEECRASSFPLFCSWRIRRCGDKQE